MVFTAIGWALGILIHSKGKTYIRCVDKLTRPQGIILLMETKWLVDDSQQPDKLTNIQLYALNNESAVNYCNRYTKDIQVISSVE